MSPRSTELLQVARRRLGAAKAALDEFRRAFVEPGDFDDRLASAAHAVQPEREQADYDAWGCADG